MPGPGVAYDPNDSIQQRFLAALALGETGGGTGSQWIGFGGIDVSNAARDQYGFPQWAGVGNTHAAGTFQFQPGTWDSVAAAHGLDFSQPGDQAAGAWYLAQDTYATRTGRSLEDDLASGNVSQVQGALASVWPSVTGNGAAPGGLVQSFLNGLGLGSGGGSTPASSTATGGGIVATIVNIFQRSGLVIIGGIIVFVALWSILAQQGVVPGPGEVAKGAAAAVAA